MAMRLHALWQPVTSTSCPYLAERLCSFWPCEPIRDHRQRAPSKRCADAMHGRVQKAMPPFSKPLYNGVSVEADSDAQARLATSDVLEQSRTDLTSTAQKMAALSAFVSIKLKVRTEPGATDHLVAYDLQHAPF